MASKKSSQQVQGIAISDLADQYGLPLYVYDAEVMQRQLTRLQRAFSVNHLRINYACKALTNLSVLRLMKRWGTGIDAVSLGEIQLALKAGFAPDEIIFTPSSVSHEELRAAAEIGTLITLDNLEAIRFWGRTQQRPVAIRINPDVKAGGNEKISVGHRNSKFGIPASSLPAVHEILNEAGVKVNGLHLHTGSDILDVDQFLQATDVLLDAAQQFSDLEFLDFGSGFKVRYHENDLETDIKLFGESVSKRFNQVCLQSGRDLVLMFEPGKFLVSEAGIFLVKVNAVKESSNTTFAGVNSGLNHFIRPMFYDAHHHIENVSNPNGKAGPYSIVGYICETDTFAWNRTLPEIRPGDILALHNAGAYCYSMASNYNSRPLPAEVLVHEGKSFLIRRRQQIDDLFRDLVDPHF